MDVIPVLVGGDQALAGHVVACQPQIDGEQNDDVACESVELEVIPADELSVLHGDEDAPKDGGGGFCAFVEPWGCGVCAVVEHVDVSLGVISGGRCGVLVMSTYVFVADRSEDWPVGGIWGAEVCENYSTDEDHEDAQRDAEPW